MDALGETQVEVHQRTPPSEAHRLTGTAQSAAEGSGNGQPWASGTDGGLGSPSSEEAKDADADLKELSESHRLAIARKRENAARYSYSHRIINEAFDDNRLALKAQVKQLMEELKAFKDGVEYESLRQANEVLKTTIDQMRISSEKLQQRNGELEERVHELEKQASAALVQDNETLSQKIKELEAMNADELLRLNAELKLRVQLETDTAQQLKDMSDKVQTRISGLEAEIKQWTEKAEAAEALCKMTQEQLQAKVDALEQQLVSSRAAASEASDAKAQQSRYESLYARYSSLQQFISSWCYRTRSLIEAVGVTVQHPMVVETRSKDPKDPLSGETDDAFVLWLLGGLSGAASPSKAARAIGHAPIPPPHAKADDGARAGPRSSTPDGTATLPSTQELEDVYNILQSTLRALQKTVQMTEGPVASDVPLSPTTKQSSEVVGEAFPAAKALTDALIAKSLMPKPPQTSPPPTRGYLDPFPSGASCIAKAQLHERPLIKARRLSTTRGTNRLPPLLNQSSGEAPDAEVSD
uniref:Uncharacterized protein n=1 Tax=Eutreptiella gymnastica TaxID=73025 RepID=A0A7S4LLP8_9EUGL